MKLLSELSKNDLSNKIVILRAGLNVPISNDGNIVDNFRIQAVLPTIEYLVKHAKKVVIISHIGRNRTESLRQVAKELQKHLPNLNFLQWRDLQSGVKEHDLILVENLRQDPREVSKDNKDRMSFAQDIIRVVGEGSIFVQDAFSVCHRSHASIVNIPQLIESYAGLLLEQEINHLAKALKPPKPSLFILGGAKFATKEPLIRKFLQTYDKIFIGGAIANEFFKAKGYEVGRSLVYDGKIPHDILYNNRIILPTSVRVTDGDGHAVYISPKSLIPDMRIVDAVPQADLLQFNGNSAKYILWNGPLGYYEGGYTQGTDRLLDMLSGSDAEILTGGGDTLATIGSDKRGAFSYVSVGGGAMLKFLQDGSLVGVKALG
ncbi:MAG: phosphoglycerate kinase [Candidatus Pacebacteria bacterium]|nr:phosphoglycerate kinase [Candidatus Paceibacterota bacterium]